MANTNGREFHLWRADSSCHRWKNPVPLSSRGHSQPCVCVCTHPLGAVGWWEATPKPCPRWEGLLSQPCLGSTEPPCAELAPCPRSTYSANSICVITKPQHRANGTAKLPCIIRAFLSGAVSVTECRAHRLMCKPKNTAGFSNSQFSLLKLTRITSVFRRFFHGMCIFIFKE